MKQLLKGPINFLAIPYPTTTDFLWLRHRTSHHQPIEQSDADSHISGCLRAGQPTGNDERINLLHAPLTTRYLNTIYYR